jgi:co-chaperonin GroES (HSP10)
MIEEELNIAFPQVDCPLKPLGNRVLVQMRLPKSKTKSGLLLTSDTKDDSYRNEQTAKVIDLGESAFHFAKDGQPWPKGAWFGAGDFVRVPLHGGDNHWIAIGEGDDKQLVLFKTFKDYEVIAKITGNPLEVKTNLAYF